MTVGRGLRVDRTAQVEHLNDAARTQIKDLAVAHDFRNAFVGNDARAVSVHGDVHGVSHADGVGDLDLSTRRKTRGDDVLCDVTAGIGRGTIHLRGILAGESAAAVRAGAAVGVDDDLASRETAVALGAAHHEASGGVHEEAGVFEPFGGHHRTDDVFNDGFDEFGLHLVAVAPFGRVLRRENDRVGGDGLAVDVPQRHLALCVGAQVRHRAVAADDGLLLHQAVCVVDGSRHIGRRFVAGVAEHQTLVARALRQGIVVLFVHALLDVGALFVVAHEHRAAAVINPVFGIVVTDAL